MRARGVREASVGRAAATDAAPLPFGPSWLEAFEPLAVGAPVGRRPTANGWVQFVCRDADRVRPWAVEVVDGSVHRVAPTIRPDSVDVVAHSVTVGWRLLGLSVRGFHRLDELVLEQRSDGRWSRHAIPPLDEALIDLSPAASGDALAWDERVLDSPIGTLYLSRRLHHGSLRVAAASTKPPLSCEGVASDMAWSELMRIRQRGARHEASNARVWRGGAADVETVRGALLRCRPDSHGPRVLRLRRDRAFLDALAVLEGVRGVLRGDARWRELWQPSARPPRA